MKNDSVFLAEIPVLHQSWIGMSEKDLHGNQEMSYANPVKRYVISVYPMNVTAAQRDPVSADYVARIEIDFIMEVPDAKVYKKNDIVQWKGQDFLVQNFPFNWGGTDPFGFDETFFGGSVHIERVT
jgi:hypothetical protein